MYLEEIKFSLGEMKPELREKFGVSSIGLFGSIVRDDFSIEHSDIDIVVDFSRPIGIEFIDLANSLEKKLERKVDLVSLKGIRPNYFSFIKNEIIYV